MNRLQANLCLLCVTLCWSAEVVLYACIPKGVPSFATSCVTSFTGAALLFFPFRARLAAAVREGGRRFVGAAFGLAALNAIYNTLYFHGTKSFDVASGAFTFCMTVVVLPVVLLTLRRSVALETWISVALVLAGIVLALGPSLRASQMQGLAIMGAGCLLRAVSIVWLADTAKRCDPLSLAILLLVFAGAISLVGWTAESPRLFLSLPRSRTLVASWAIYAYFIVAFAQTLNVFALRRVTAANATVVYSLEIVFSIAWGVLLPAGIVDRVTLTPRIALGAALVVAGTLAEIADFRGRRRETEREGCSEAAARDAANEKEAGV